jgi:hypothetical protein
MAKDDDLGPFKGLVTAGTALLSMGAFVMTKWVGFLASPPPLHYGEKETFWLALATICCGVVCALIFLFLPWKKKTAAKLQVVLGILTLLALIVFVVVSIAYNQQRSKWTFSFQGEWVLIGDRYTDAARVDSRTPGINKDILFKDFGEKSTDVWTENGLQRRQLRLGVIYISASVIGGICFSLAAWVVLLFATKSSQKRAAAKPKVGVTRHND